MEVGAVKQAFNNEIIQLKKNLNQARIHTIHKLTRKAKKDVKEEAPEKIKEKFKRQAASAVNEVLIIKKIKPRVIARFIVTHTDELHKYLNKPTVDEDRACARLLLHKSLQAKYKHIRKTFSNIPIKDLLMSRQERLKLKKEALLDKKMKKDKNQKVVNAEGEWNVEEIKTRTVKDVPKSIRKNFQESNDDVSGDDVEMEFDENADSGAEEDDGGENDESDEEVDSDDGEGPVYDKKSDTNMVEEEDEDDENDESQSNERESKIESDEESDEDEQQSVKSKKLIKVGKFSPSKCNVKANENISSALTFEQLGKNRRKPEIKLPPKPKDMHKNKNLKDKLQSRKFKKESNESQAKETKVVDPFFITSTGENYMSVAEPRQPDEVKEIHKQGNRKERRAAMFGHVPNIKPRKDFSQNKSARQNDSSNGFRHKYNQSDEGRYNNRNDGFRNRKDEQFRSKDSKFRSQGDKSFECRNTFKRGNDKLADSRNDKFKGRNDAKFKGGINDVEAKVEKLHPSWEAKKKQSGILPFQGKKIVFDEG